MALPINSHLYIVHPTGVIVKTRCTTNQSHQSELHQNEDRIVRIVRQLHLKKWNASQLIETSIMDQPGRSFNLTRILSHAAERWKTYLMCRIKPKCAERSLSGKMAILQLQKNIRTASYPRPYFPHHMFYIFLISDWFTGRLSLYVRKFFGVFLFLSKHMRQQYLFASTYQRQSRLGPSSLYSVVWQKNPVFLFERKSMKMNIHCRPPVAKFEARITSILFLNKLFWDSGILFWEIQKSFWYLFPSYLPAFDNKSYQKD